MPTITAHAADPEFALASESAWTTSW